MTTRLTKDARLERQPPSFLASRGFVARHSRSRSLPSVNLKKKRDCSPSRLDREQCPNFEGLFKIITKVFKSHVKLHVKFNATKISIHFSQYKDREFFCLRVRSSKVTWKLHVKSNASTVENFFCLLQYFRVALNWPPRKPTLFARLARSLAIT